MLEACGHASGWAAGQASWDARVWSCGTTSTLLEVGPHEYVDDPPPEPISTMEAYDLEFDHRLAVVDARLVHVSDPAAPLLAEPIAVDACAECGWREWCFEQMEEAGDLSLLPGMSLAKRRNAMPEASPPWREWPPWTPPPPG